MDGHLFIAHGDLTQLTADAIAFSSSRSLAASGDLYSSFAAHVPDFADGLEQVRSRVGRLDLGDTEWLPLRAGGKPAGVVITVATRRDATPRDAGLVAGNAVRRAVVELRKAGHNGRLLIGLPAFRLGMGGDRWRRFESARAQVRAVADLLKDDSCRDVDVAFVAYTPALYRIYLEARQKEIGRAGATGFPELERALRDGGAVLFVGAGLSKPGGLPDWGELIDRLCADMGIDSKGVEYLDVAQWYREKQSNARLAEVLRDRFAGQGTPTLAHYLLMALPVRHVLTTNYDHLIEKTLLALKRHPLKVISDPEVAQTGGAGTYVVKFHGDADRAEEIVLSRDDYEAFFEKRPAMAALLEGLLLNRTFFFVGYSLHDINFRQVFSRIARILKESRRPAFATKFWTPGPLAELEREQWGKQGLHLVPVDAPDPDLRPLALLRFLDALAENVILDAPRLALADDTPTPPALKEVAEAANALGEALDAVVWRGPLSDPEVRFLSELLTALTAQGWRPNGTTFSLWKRLAEQVDDTELRRTLLVKALAEAEKLSDAEDIRRLMEKLK